MPDIFLSYSRKDSAFAQKIELALSALGLAVWRDQSQLHAGEHWNSALGEAIAASNACLLLWSEAAAQSDAVKHEWNTAMALHKKVVPCRLDGTPVPPSLSSLHWISFESADDAAAKILQTLRREAPAQSGQPPRKRLLPAAWLAALAVLILVISGATFWFVRGRAAPAPRPKATTAVAITPQPAVRPPESVAESARILAPAKKVLTAQPHKLDDDKLAMRLLRGTVLAADNERLAGVLLTLTVNGQQQTQSSDANGHFKFEVAARRGAMGKLLATKKGFRDWENEVGLDLSDYQFLMESEK